MSYSFNSSGYTLSNYLSNSSINTIGYIGATEGTFTISGVSLYAFRNVSTLYVTPGVWLVNCQLDGSTGAANYTSAAISTNGLTTWSNGSFAGYTFMSPNLGNTILGINNRFSNSSTPQPIMNISCIHTFSQGTTSSLYLSLATDGINQTYTYYYKCVRIA